MALESRLDDHVDRHWKDHPYEISVRFRGPYAYVDAHPLNEQGEPSKGPAIRLCRLQYLGTPKEWGFAFHKYSDNSYEPSFLPTGSPTGTPEECFDLAAMVYLQDIDA